MKKKQEKEVRKPATEEEILDDILYDLKLDKSMLPLDDKFGDNLRFIHPDTKEQLKSYLTVDDKGYRELTLRITSWLGSIGAVHYYSELIDYSIRFTRIEDVENKSSCGGYATKGIPEKYSNFRIKLKRPVTQKDIDHDIDYDREKYMMSEIGQTTNGFWTEDDAIEIGIATFKQLFKGKWKLTIDSYSGGKLDKVIYRDKI